MRSAAAHRSSAIPLALAYAALVLYASLYPFDDWRWPPGQQLGELLTLPRTRWLGAFDVSSNVFGYLPLGALLFLAVRRSGWGSGVALALAIVAAALLSWGCEVLQQFLPRRVPALEDWLANASGALLGALLALAAQSIGLIERWHGFRQRWFERDAGGALALLALWPVALLFPAPVALGLGQVGARLLEWGEALTEDVPWAAPAHALFGAPAELSGPLRPLAELLLVAAGLLAPILVAYTVMRPGWRRGVMAVGALLLALGGMSLATLLNFGPQHALAWLTPASGPGLGFGLLLALLLLPLPRRVCAGAALLVLAVLVAGVAQAPADPYFAQSLQSWEQGRFVRFHGLAQWIGWLWPYLAMAWLLTRLAQRG